MRGAVRERWFHLTDDELYRVRGTSEKLVSLLQEKHGYSKKEEVEGKLSEVIEGLVD